MRNNMIKEIVENGGEIHELVIPSEYTGGTGLCNPSIFLDEEKLYVNIRHVQYSLYHSENKQKFPTLWGPLSYLHPENDMTLSTKNFICEIDKKLFKINSFKEIDTKNIDSTPMWHFVGLEDGRLVKWNNKLFLCGVRRDTTNNGIGRMELSELENGVEVNRTRIEVPNFTSYCEKNWMPIVDMPFHFIKWTNPTEIVKVDLVTNTSKTVKSVDQVVHTNRDIRGGSQVISYKNYYIAITHEVNLFFNKLGQKDANYYHRFIVWDKDWNIVHTSPEFTFFSSNIEFSCGIALVDNSIIVTVGLQDTTSFIIKIPSKYFENFVGITSSCLISKKVYNNSKLLNWVCDTLNDLNNFYLGEYYYSLKQYASAITFFLRSAEYGEDQSIVYEALLKISKCLEFQGNRQTTIKTTLLHAINLQPTRPEAYYFLSKLFENLQQWFECYTYSNLGLLHKNNIKKFITFIDYPGEFALRFQKALSGWWIGRIEESIDTLKTLSQETLPEEYSTIVKWNLSNVVNSN